MQALFIGECQIIYYVNKPHKNNKLKLVLKSKISFSLPIYGNTSHFIRSNFNVSVDNIEMRYFLYKVIPYFLY